MVGQCNYCNDTMRHLFVKFPAKTAAPFTDKIHLLTGLLGPVRQYCLAVPYIALYF